MRLPLYVLAVSGGALVQCTVVPVVGVGGIVPDVPVVLTVLLALRYGAEAGCLTGFALGLAQDAVAGGPLGLHALSKALLGFAAGDLPRWVLVTRPIVPVGLAVLATIVDGLARFALLQLFQYPAPLGEIFTRVIVPQAGYNGIVAAAALAWPAGRLLSRG
ncbi:MAG TPA: rod shape-determining protein MreD [Methylomirabilota bacterium]|nr:rod shape-determining protein MreD [Methylomirabilota bacterium]